MRFYLTHCSKEKDPALKQLGLAVTPDKLYTETGIQQFMQRCQEKNVAWGILSDLYGVYLSTERHVWYEKHPDTVTPQEEDTVVSEFDRKLAVYDDIFFHVRPDSFHPFYQRVLRRTVLAERVQIFHAIDQIE